MIFFFLKLKNRTAKHNSLKLKKLKKGKIFWKEKSKFCIKNFPKFCTKLPSCQTVAVDEIFGTQTELSKPIMKSSLQVTGKIV